MAGKDTEALPDPGDSVAVRRFALQVITGGSRSAPAAWQSSSDRCSIGLHPSNDLVIDERSVSRFHCELVLDSRGVRVRDLGSRNGTRIDGTLVLDGFARDGSVIRVGKTELRLKFGEDN